MGGKPDRTPHCPEIALIGESRAASTKSCLVCYLSTGLSSSSRQLLLLQPLAQLGHSTPPPEAGLKLTDVNWRDSQCRGVARTCGAAAVGNMQSHAGHPPARRSTRQQATAASSVCLRYSGRRRAACCTGETLSRRWDMSCVAAHSCGWMRQVGLRWKGKEAHSRRALLVRFRPVHGRGGH